MELFAADLDRLAFLLEADASCYLDDLIAQGTELVTEELPPDERPKYITNYIGSKQKLVDWIWKHTAEGVASVLDALSGFKKDIALFALGKTCMSGKGGFGHFSSSTDYGKRQDNPDELKERFANNVARINALVFDNGKECNLSCL